MARCRPRRGGDTRVAARVIWRTLICKQRGGGEIHAPNAHDHREVVDRPREGGAISVAMGAVESGGVDGGGGAEIKRGQRHEQRGPGRVKDVRSGNICPTRVASLPASTLARAARVRAGLPVPRGGSKSAAPPCTAARGGVGWCCDNAAGDGHAHRSCARVPQCGNRHLRGARGGEVSGLRRRKGRGG